MSIVFYGTHPLLHMGQARGVPSESTSDVVAGVEVETGGILEAILFKSHFKSQQENQ